MQFKREVGLLLLAISLFAVATFFYTYQAASNETVVMSQSLVYPYRGIALGFVGVGFASMVVASISYSKKIKNIVR